MEARKAEFGRQGIQVAALSYDSRKILSSFAQRMKLTYPLLSDPDSQVIRALGLLDVTIPKGKRGYGVPWPASYLIAPDGTVKARYLDSDYGGEYTAGSVLLSFSTYSKDGWLEARTRHLTLRWRSVDASAKPGWRTAVLVEVSLPEKFHIYAPDVGGSYIPTRLTVDRGEALAVVHPAKFPRPKTLHLPAINEELPVYEGTFRITKEVTFAQQSALRSAARDGSVTVKGRFRYQACDDTQCYPPVTVPLEWSYSAPPEGGTRVPVKLRDE